MIRVKGVEQEMCVCGSVCGTRKNTGDVPAPYQRAKSVSVCASGTGSVGSYRIKNTPTSLWEKLCVDVLKGVLIDDSAGTFLEDKMEFHPSVKITLKNIEKKVCLVPPSSGQIW